MPMSNLADLIEPLSTEEYIKQFQSTSPDARRAFENAKATRNAEDQKPGPRDLNLRDAEHALYTQSLVDDSPVFGRLAALFGIPAYTAGKVLSQNYGLAPGTIKALTGADASSTKPDLRELYWGLRPVFSSIKPAPRDTYGRGENPEHP